MSKRRHLSASGQLETVHPSAVENGWRNVRNYKTFGTELIRTESIVPLEEIPKQLEFEISANRPVKCNLLTRFYIKCFFESRATENDPWTKVLATDYANVVLEPCWFESLLKNITIYHGNMSITSSDSNPIADLYFNKFLYYVMKKDLKRLLAPEKSHFANHLPSSLEDWDFSSEESLKSWKDYAAHVFHPKGCEFSWSPLVWPWLQNSDYVLNQDQIDLPFPSLGKLHVRLNFKDSQNHIFRLKSTNTKQYRVRFKHFSLMYEENRINPTIARPLKSQILFPGNVVDSRIESIASNEMHYRTRFLNASLPESLIIFCVKKSVLGETYTYNEADCWKKPIFLKHNIKEVELLVQGNSLSLRPPHFGQLDLECNQLKYLHDVEKFGIRNIPCDLSKLSMETAFDHPIFPHIYINLLSNLEKHRILPINSESGLALKKDNTIDLLLKFQSTGSQVDCNYVILLTYSDYSQCYDFKTNKFSNRFKNVSL